MDPDKGILGTDSTPLTCLSLGSSGQWKGTMFPGQVTSANIRTGCLEGAITVKRVNNGKERSKREGKQMCQPLCPQVGLLINLGRLPISKSPGSFQHSESMLWLTEQGREE